MLAIENGVRVSLRLVKCHLRKCGMGRRKNYHNIADVVNLVQDHYIKIPEIILHGYEIFRVNEILFRGNEIIVLLVSFLYLSL